MSDNDNIMTPVFDSPAGFTTSAPQDDLPAAVTVTDVPDYPVPDHLTAPETVTVTAGQPNALFGLPSGPVDDTIKSVLHGLLIGQTDPATAKTALTAQILGLLTSAENVAVNHLPAMARMIVSSVLGGLQAQQQTVAATIAARIVDALS